MKWGLDEPALKILDEKLFEPLKKNRVKVWIFGSRARGDFKRFSDLDVLIEPSLNLPKGFISQIKEDLELSRLPIRIDLVNLTDLAESYRENILRERKEIE